MTPINSAAELLQRRAQVAEQARRHLDAAWFDFQGNERLRMVFDLEMHLAFLAESVRCAAPRLFVEYATWTWQLLNSCGGEVDRFDRCLLAIELQLCEAGRGEWLVAAVQTLAQARQHMAAAPLADESHLRDGNPHKTLCEAFLAACLGLRRGQALALVQRAVRKGMPVADLYLNVITPVMHELGRLWHLNRVSVGQEHYCTAVAQSVMAQLFPTIFDEQQPVAGRMVSACVPGELHEIGARMVADMFQMNGWDTSYLGADVPTEAVIDRLIEADADVLAISVTLGAHLGFARDLIAAVRAHPECGRVKILVGGGAFSVDPAVWRTLGADGWAADPQSALDQVAAWRS